MLVQQLLFSTKKICFVKFFRGALEAQNTVNSSLRNKNAWISIFFCMRHIYRLYKTHNQFQPVLAKMAEKTLFLAQKCNFKAFFELSGSLGG